MLFWFFYSCTSRVWSRVSGGRRRDCWIVWDILSRSIQFRGWSSFLWPLSCPVFEARLLQAALHRAELCTAQYSPLLLWSKTAFVAKGSLAAGLLPLPLPHKPTVTTAFVSLCWCFRSTFDLKLKQMKTNLPPDFCGEPRLTLPSAAVKLSHLPFTDFSPRGPCYHTQNVSQRYTFFHRACSGRRSLKVYNLISFKTSLEWSVWGLSWVL